VRMLIRVSVSPFSLYVEVFTLLAVLVEKLVVSTWLMVPFVLHPRIPSFNTPFFFFSLRGSLKPLQEAVGWSPLVSRPPSSIFSVPVRNILCDFYEFL